MSNFFTAPVILLMARYRRWVGRRGWGRWWGWVKNWRRAIPSVRTIWTSYSYESKKWKPLAQTCLDGQRDVSLLVLGNIPAISLHQGIEIIPVTLLRILLY